MSRGPAVVVALAAALAFGLASALQHEQARVVQPGSRGIFSLVTRARWLLGILFDSGAVVLQGVALDLGAVALVQPLLVAGLPVAVAVSAHLEQRRLTRREVVGVGLTTVGLAVFAPAVATTPRGVEPGRPAALVAAAVIAVATAVLLTSGSRGRSRGRYGPVALGTAAGTVIGAGSVLLAVTAGRVHSPRALFGSWAPYAAIAVGLLGLYLGQLAFQSGALGAPLAALSVVEPVVAVVLAATVLHERLPHGAAARGALVVGSVLAVLGVLALCQDPGDHLRADDRAGPGRRAHPAGAADRSA